MICLNLLLGLFVLSQNIKSANHRVFSIMSLVAALWAFANYMDDTIISSVWLQTSYALGALVISMGLVWTLFITKSKVSKSKYLLLAIVTLLFCIGSYLQNFIFISYNKSAAGSIAFGEPGWGLIPYGIYYLVTAFLIIWKLHKAKITASNEEQRKQFQNIQHGASITLLVTCLSSFILPFFSILPFGGTDNVGFLIFLLFVAYSITKHRLFNIRVIAIEVVIFILWVTLVFQIFTAKTHEDLAIRIAILATSIIFGILLIRSTLNEIKQQEHIEKLSDELRKAYAHQIENSAHTNVVGPTEHVAGPRGN